MTTKDQVGHLQTQLDINRLLSNQALIMSALSRLLLANSHGSGLFLQNKAEGEATHAEQRIKALKEDVQHMMEGSHG